MANYQCIKTSEFILNDNGDLHVGICMLAHVHSMQRKWWIRYYVECKKNIE